MQDGKIGDFLRMQHLLAVEKGWIDNRVPEKGHMSLLWSIDEIGEVIAIIKKKGAAAIMENESVRAHFTEEIADVFMYFFDMMECYGITAEEFTAAYCAKFRRNMGRDWRENDALYEKSTGDFRYVQFCASVFGEKLSPTAAHLLESLKKTNLQTAICTDVPLPEGLDTDGIAVVSDMGMIPNGFTAAECLYCVPQESTAVPDGAHRFVLDLTACENAASGWGTLLGVLGF